MAESSKDDAIKARILEHMNNDHQASLVLYLRNYLSLSPSAAANPQLTDISLAHLTIRSSGQTHKIPLNPPLTSLAGARGRLIEMDTASSATLGLTPLVTTWTTPTAANHLAVVFLVLFYLALYSQKSRVVPGSAPYTALEKLWPGGAKGYLRIQDMIIVPLIAIHAVETAVMAWRLKKARVGAGSSVWWKWIASCAVEGVGAHQRFGVLARKAKKDGGL